MKYYLGIFTYFGHGYTQSRAIHKMTCLLLYNYDVSILVAMFPLDILG